MASILQFPTDRTRGFSFAGIPIVKRAEFFLAQAAQAGGIKLTELGNLNRGFVQKFWDEVLDKDENPFCPSREDDCWEASHVSFILSESGYVEKAKKKLVITEKGRSLLETGPTQSFYRDLFEVGAFSWEWSYPDRYEDDGLVQDAVASLIDALWKDHDRSINTLQIFDHAFETVRGRVGEAAGELERLADFDSPVHWFMRCLQSRFVIRFCLPFGLLKRTGEAGILTELNEPFEKTDFLLSEFHDIACPLIHRH